MVENKIFLKNRNDNRTVIKTVTFTKRYSNIEKKYTYGGITC